MKTYQFGEKTYLMKPLVLGQLRALMEILKTVKIERINPSTIVFALEEKLHFALAVVLIEEGLPIKEAIEKYRERALELECLISPEDAMQVVEDFFELTPISSLAEKLAGTIKNLTQQISKTSSTASQTGTSEGGS